MIHIESLKVVFNSGEDNEVIALNLDNLIIGDGSWCNLIGPNGSGKTTLIRALSGDLDSSEMLEGCITLDDQNVSDWKSRQFYGVVQVLEQNPEKNLIPSMSIRENLWMYISDKPWYSIEHLRKKHEPPIKALLARFGMNLESRLDTQVGLLSGGQSQAVALACVLARSPRILLLDEFLASIDPTTVPLLLNVVKQVSEENGITVIAVSHDLDNVVSSGGRIVMLSSGRIVEDIDSMTQSVTKKELVSVYTSLLEKDGTL